MTSSPSYFERLRLIDNRSATLLFVPASNCHLRTSALTRRHTRADSVAYLPGQLMWPNVDGLIRWHTKARVPLNLAPPRRIIASRRKAITRALKTGIRSLTKMRRLISDNPHEGNTQPHIAAIFHSSPTSANFPFSTVSASYPSSEGHYATERGTGSAARPYTASQPILLLQNAV